MKASLEFLKTPLGHLMLVVIVLGIGGCLLAWQHGHRTPAPLPHQVTIIPPSLPQTFTREIARLKLPTAGANDAVAIAAGVSAVPARTAAMPAFIGAGGNPKPESAPPPVPLPLSLFTSPNVGSSERTPATAVPYGRLIPCETVVTLESNHLETPVIGLVTEDVWHDGQLIIPKNTEVHGRAAMDRARERLAATGSWVLVWRTEDDRDGEQLTVSGIALDRERDASTGAWGLHDGSAGLRGEILRTDNLEEIKLFASTFLSTATTALEDTTTNTSVLGNVIVPSATARNATLAGTSAILKEYADKIKAAIDRDGIYVRVPAGKAFYLYVTQAIDPAQGGRGELHSNAKSQS